MKIIGIGKNVLRMAAMNSTQQATLTKFYWGLGIFILSASTVLFVTDPYIMADIGLIILSIYLMVTGIAERNASRT